MKLHFDVKTMTGETVSLSFPVTTHDTVKAIKERIASAEPNPFPEQVLFLKGERLCDDAKVLECGLEDGDRLVFEARASEEALAGQLHELLRASGPVSVEEVGLMYPRKHGVAIGQALQALGKNDLLKSFLEKMGKHFNMEGDKVQASPTAPAPKEAAAQTAVGAHVLVVTILMTLQLPSMMQDPVEHEMSIKGTDTVRDLKERMAVSVPFESQVLSIGGKLLGDDVRLADLSITDGSRLELVASASEPAVVGQLVALLTAQGPMSRVGLDDAFCLRYGVSASQVVQALGWGEKFGRFLERHPRFVSTKGCVSLAPTSSTELNYKAEGNAAYLALHQQLSGGGFAKSLEDALDGLADIFAKETFLNVARVVKAGAAANGTAIPGAAGAELVLFVEGLPPIGQDIWLPGLAASVACGISERLIGQQGIQNVHAEGGSLRVSTDGPLGDVAVFLSPVYGDYSKALEALRRQGRAARVAGVPSFAEQSARFVQRQPGGVKAAIRLVKWWRQQQQWSSVASSPSDALVELIVAHVVAERSPRDLREAVDAALWSMANFGDLRLTWPLASRSYREADICPALLEQRPLVMDPTNPLTNVADPSLFQPNELAERARGGMFF